MELELTTLRSSHCAPPNMPASHSSFPCNMEVLTSSNHDPLVICRTPFYPTPNGAWTPKHSPTSASNPLKTSPLVIPHYLSRPILTQPQMNPNQLHSSPWLTGKSLQGQHCNHKWRIFSLSWALKAGRCFFLWFSSFSLVVEVGRLFQMFSLFRLPFICSDFIF